ncbi:hypothetical protein C8Q79DRAFT_934621 [Trametes meyenii]|nr:hypothetical protein C8Q79DRAFT_934621 [Trametes meyenii]
MPPPLDRETLKNMKRSDLQRICKEYGIKANLKTEALIDLLIDTTQARPRPTPPSQPHRAPSGRTVSRSVAAGSRLRGSSSSSVIIHDTDEEDNATGRDDNRSRSVAAAASSGSEVPPRTRRAKETQYRLGVGRPTVAGGSGARAVTRSTSLSVRGKRTRASRSVKPVEAVIQEEEEPNEPEMPEAGPSGTTHDPEPFINPVLDPPESPALQPPPGVSSVSEDVKALVFDAVKPLHEQIHMLHTELERRSSEAADVRQLTSQLQTLHAEVQSLRSQAATASHLQAEVHQLKSLVTSLLEGTSAGSTVQSAKSLGKIRVSDEGSSQTTMAGSTPSHFATEPMDKFDVSSRTTQPLLGKRHRDQDDSQLDATETSEDRHSEEDLDQRAVRPVKKRLKLSDEVLELPQSVQGTDDQATTESQDVDPGMTEAIRPPPAPFTIFSGPEELPDDPPPTTHLSDLFPMASTTSNGHTPTPVNGAGMIVRPMGADENAPNHFGFNFSFNTSIFDPMASTPFESGTPVLAYPEPPTSPTPGVPSGGFIERAGGRIERNDIYHPHGRRHAQSQAQSQAQVPSPSRPQSATSRPASRAAIVQVVPQQSHFGTGGGGISGNGTVNPSALMGLRTTLPSVPELSLDASTNSNSGPGFNSQPRRVASSSEIGMSLGMSSTLPLPPETPAPPMKRTMYGTELESDTRFGDFGVEGVATGFWAGLVPRF